MPRILKCSFCGQDFPHPQGLTYVKNDGSLLHFCSRRCKVSLLNFRRDARKIKWTAYYGKKEKA